MENPNYYTVLQGVGVYIVALMVWDHLDEAYGMAQTFGPYRTKFEAGQKAEKLSTERGLELR